jgi:hypothetical protein
LPEEAERNVKEGKMNDAVLMIAVTEAKCAAEKETTLEGRLKAAMNKTKDFWMSTNDDLRFRAAVGAVLLLSDDSDQERIKDEMKQLQTLSALLNGVPVNLEEVKPLKNAIGLIKMWGDIKSL